MQMSLDKTRGSPALRRKNRWRVDCRTTRAPQWIRRVAAVVSCFVCWVAFAATIAASVDEPPGRRVDSDAEWERLFQERLGWWSLRPVARTELPAVENAAWCRNEVDRFILARLESAALEPAPQADRRTLVRRASFALTGLPPRPEEVERFLSDNSPGAVKSLVDRLIDSPHFGERWARHWMDVVHYADTHGYEWDIAAKGAWMYRDYVVRAFNRDVPFRQFALEQIAGDLLDRPRVDAASNLNESLIGTVALRLGERRHGDSAEFEGIHQEAIENVIDTVTKAFQATTVACARCHDHKLDALSQRDYYSLAGTFMSSRWVCRTVDAANPNVAATPELKQIRNSLREAMAELWLRESESLGGSLLAAQAVIEKQPDAPDRAAGLPARQVVAWSAILDGKPEKPEHAEHPWAQLATAMRGGTAAAAAWEKLVADYARLRTERRAANATSLRLIADFSDGTLDAGWHTEGFGLNGGFARDGDVVVADAGPDAVRQILRAGLYSHTASARLAGALHSPLLAPDAPFLSLEITGGGLAARHVVVDNALFPESRYQFIDQAAPGWHTVSTLPAESGKGRRVYVELCTKSLNNYYPPRTGLVSKYTPDQQADPRSWFGVTRVFAHDAPGQVPQDELGRFQKLFAAEPPATLADAAQRVAAWLRGAIERWRDGTADAGDATLLDWMRQQQLLTNRADATERIAALVRDYRAIESRLQPDRVVGGVADYAEGRDDRLGTRGSYTEFADSVPRGPFRFVSHLARRDVLNSCGRLEFAEAIVSPDNPLTARVFVNRVWHYLFGAGLVTTCDDFGHLGEQPSHPELLDYLAARFMDEGWSVKKLVRLMVLSATWQQSGAASAAAIEHDPANRLWHHYPTRRLEAESIRDAMLAASGRLDLSLGGPPIDPHRRAEDKDKRLHFGPIDGDGRRSLYTKMTLMEPPRFLAIFNQPIPKLTVGRRDVTNVPDQALALLNDPFVIGQAEHWAERLARDGSPAIEDRVRRLFETALGRPPDSDELNRFANLARRVAELRQIPPDAILTSRPVWQDVAHAVFNLKEFIYVR